MITIRIYTKALIQKAKTAGRYSTAGVYAHTLNSFLRFIGKEDVTFSEISSGMIKQYEEYLLKKGLRHNTLSTYMRMLRSIFNQAREDDIPVPCDINELFHYVFTGYEPTTKRAISPLLIRQLFLLDLRTSPTLCFSRDLFLLSFYLRGMPFVDLAYLRKSDIRQNTVYYYRHKTHQQLVVYIEPCAAKILTKYSRKNSDLPYLLPILTDTGETGFKQYKSALRLYNLHLHRLSEKLHLPVSLTSYVARHSWATTAKNEGVNISIISESLGHASEKVTYTYLASFDNNTICKANRKVIATINTEKREKNSVKKSNDFSSNE